MELFMKKESVMKSFDTYQKPVLQEYSRFGFVAEGASPAAPGEERTDVNACNISGLDESAE